MPNFAPEEKLLMKQTANFYPVPGKLTAKSGKLYTTDKRLIFEEEDRRVDFMVARYTIAIPGSLCLFFNTLVSQRFHPSIQGLPYISGFVVVAVILSFAWQIYKLVRTTPKLLILEFSLMSLTRVVNHKFGLNKKLFSIITDRDEEYRFMISTSVAVWVEGINSALTTHQRQLNKLERGDLPEWEVVVPSL